MLVRTSDHTTFTVPDAVVAACGTLLAAGDSRPCGECEDATVVPLPNVAARVMTHIVHYYTKLQELANLSVPPTSTASFKVRFFESLGRPGLFDVMEAANYLDARRLLDDACAFVADVIRGGTPEKIRAFFMMPHDMTSEEARQFAAEFQWALA